MAFEGFSRTFKIGGVAMSNLKALKQFARYVNNYLRLIVPRQIKQLVEVVDVTNSPLDHDHLLSILNELDSQGIASRIYNDDDGKITAFLERLKTFWVNDVKIEIKVKEQLLNVTFTFADEPAQSDALPIYVLLSDVKHLYLAQIVQPALLKQLAEAVKTGTTLGTLLELAAETAGKKEGAKQEG